MNSSAATGALILILVALAGAGCLLSFHPRGALRHPRAKARPERARAFQQYQIAQDSASSSKADALNNLSKEVDALQASLGKVTNEQSDTLTGLHKQIAALQESQQAQDAAQKKFSDYASQIEKIKHDVQVMPAQVTPAPVVTTPAPAAAPAPSHADASPITPITTAETTPNVQLPVAPHADSTIVDLRPASVTTASAARALPVELPVALSVSLSQASR